MGWPSLLAALLLAAGGTWYRKPAAIWAALALTLPMAWYLSGSPACPVAGIVPVFALGLSALTGTAERRWPSFTGVGIYTAFLLALAYRVVSQP